MHLLVASFTTPKAFHQRPNVRSLHLWGFCFYGFKRSTIKNKKHSHEIERFGSGGEAQRRASLAGMNVRFINPA